MQRSQFKYHEGPGPVHRPIPRRPFKLSFVFGEEQEDFLEPAGDRNISDGFTIARCISSWLPDSLPDLVDILIDIMGVAICEETLKPGYTRYRWACRCGTLRYHDQPPTSADVVDVEGQKQKSDRVTVEASTVLGRLGNYFDCASSHLLKHRDQVPSTSKNADPKDIPIHLLLCIDKGERRQSSFKVKSQNRARTKTSSNTSESNTQ
ncbi:hypothetical protein SCAR479_10329 [Seiridium cardinale]|uniref:Uncharacterized protein n=1 Tax=Seiridium cardinale TaxID=138064 RepID=A0ABR2XGR3_9PEZI